MNVWKLRLAMIGTLTLIISLSTAVFTLVLFLTGYFNLITLGVLVVAFNIVQWLISPYIINAIYHAREITQTENPELHRYVDELSKKSNIKKPRLMLAQIPVPNAFAYSSPIAGSRVAVTSGLLNTLNSGEVEAVIGHELGHLKHKDVATMMFVSLLPSVLMYVGYSFMWSARGNSKDNGSGTAVLGIAFIAFSFILNIFTLYLSRLREYYADRHSTTVVDQGPQKLSEGLAKIVNATKNMGRTKAQAQHLNAFRTLFITDPDKAATDSIAIKAAATTDGQKMVQELLLKKLTTADKIMEALSTHPNIVKRLAALKELA